MGEQTGREAPIGVFDSGAGGLTVARAIIDQLPHESITYLGDTAHVPYGPRPVEQIREYALGCLDSLVKQGVKALVIACNSASAAMVEDARARYDVPVLEVIHPAVRRAVAASANGRVGVIATAATVGSGAYERVFGEVAARTGEPVEVVSQACPRFVDFVERGITNGRQIMGLASAYVQPLQEAGVDTLVLGCTHYPMLTGVLGVVMGDEVTLVNSADETAKDLYRELTRLDLFASDDAQARLEFRCTGDAEQFFGLARRFLGPLIERVDNVDV
ncbi:glutamate racemase [Epidermidibacterium keratini]|uniref:Glutamate racemase n=1 Tax=Epidermidibacterium keratini TaxID=1891644 RepID=A0A7L4YJQ0_9ACTN|nr:glutamate racemase [Epidermidibacterium keratini]QHB99504.1 glutamate racemase [Epidermidibacterium keratini]